MTPVVVLRPEPGNRRTAAALRALGMDVRQMPLFAVVPVDWTSPDPARFDALLLTSANAVRHAGVGIAALKHLPVVAVGEATAAAARAAGFGVALTGNADGRAAVALAQDRGFARLLHLTGRDRAATGEAEDRDRAVEPVTVYASNPVPLDDAVARSFENNAILLHSTRAAMRLAALVDASGAARARIALVAISQAVGDAAGAGWQDVTIAPQPTDAAVVACAAARASTRAIDQRG